MTKSWTAGTALEWTVEMRSGNETFTGEEQWLIESVGSSPGPEKYQLVRSTTGTEVVPWLGTQYYRGLMEQFTVGEDASGFLYIPMNSALAFGYAFPEDTLIVWRHETDFSRARVGYLPPARPDTLRVVSNPDSGLTGFYHSTSSYRISYRLKGYAASTSSADYFPPLNVGDTLSWSFYQVYSDVGYGWALDGRMSWKVIAIDSTSGTRVTQILRDIAGWHYGTAQFRHYDSVWVSSGTKVFQMTEDVNHKVSFSMPTYDQMVWPITFDRFYSSILADEITVDAPQTIPSARAQVTLRKNYGMTAFQAGVGYNISEAVRCTRIQ